MKKLMKCIMVALCLAVAVAFAAGVQSTNVQAKKKVTYKLKKGTLTIKGKGNMPKKIKVKKNKVKKIVIKKGVKNISNNAFKNFKKVKKISIAKTVKKIGVNAFYKTAIKNLTIPKNCKKLGSGFMDYCKKLDKVTLPGDFVIIDKKGNAKSIRNKAHGTTVDTVTFNSNLDYNACAYFDTYDFQTAASDPKFKTFDGVVYTKDGSGIVRVPSGRDTLVIREGCTTFNTHASVYLSGKDSGIVCDSLVKITLPSTLKKVDYEAYPDYASDEKCKTNTEILFGKSNLEIPEIVKLKIIYKISPDALVKKLPTRIANNNNFLIGDSTYLIEGNGAATSNVPDGIKTICEAAYYSDNGLVKAVLPASVEEIGESAFMFSNLGEINLDNVKKIGRAAFTGTQFTKIELPAIITAIPDYAFFDCDNLTEVTCKGELKSVGAYAFNNTRLNIADFLADNTKLETINESAFENVGWTNITIPANIKTVGAYAFAESNNTKFVLIKGSTAGFNMLAFGVCNGVTYQFEQGMSQAWVTPDHDYYTSGKKMKFNASWDKVSEVNGYEIWLAKDKSLKKGVKKYTYKYNAKNASVSLTKKKAKGLKYFGIRAFKTVNGKKVYSKWNIQKL